jgi:hypothetical protein
MKNNKSIPEGGYKTGSLISEMCFTSRMLVKSGWTAVCVVAGRTTLKTGRFYISN